LKDDLVLQVLLGLQDTLDLLDIMDLRAHKEIKDPKASPGILGPPVIPDILDREDLVHWVPLGQRDIRVPRTLRVMPEI
jgi:hypothetical protein